MSRNDSRPQVADWRQYGRGMSSNDGRPQVADWRQYGRGMSRNDGRPQVADWRQHGSGMSRNDGDSQVVDWRQHGRGMNRSDGGPQVADWRQHDRGMSRNDGRTQVADWRQHGRRMSRNDGDPQVAAWQRHSRGMSRNDGDPQVADWRQHGREMSKDDGPPQFTDWLQRVRDDWDGIDVPLGSAQVGTRNPSTTSIRNVELLGTFSVDEQRKYSHDDSQLKFLDPTFLNFHDMEVNMDLNRAYHLNEMPDFSVGERLHNTLRWILDKKEFLVEKGPVSRIPLDFIGERHLFVKLMMAPFNSQLDQRDYEDCAIYATMFHGTVYFMECNLYELETYYPSEYFRSTYLWAFKFEQYLSGGATNEGLHTNTEHHCEVKVEIGGRSILVDAMQNVADGVRDHCSDPGAYIIMKHHPDNKWITAFKHKMISSWSRGVLAGSEYLILGYRTRGVVQKLQKIKIRDLPATAGISPDTALSFLNKVLDFIKAKVSQKPGKVFLVYKNDKKVYCFDAEDAMEQGTVPCVLPDWYKNQIFA
ncbi:uncharacterized protein LOC135202508 isoform X2 [Macrobrachium nipponense]|uniref:uncharacterized protein LOC135202508 isoform X2 n=1 Tax=Macrobrachium nipponense TaxID=159736 RepID=UPI0030C860F9